MPSILMSLIVWVLGSAVARLLAGAGMGVLTYYGIAELVETFLNQSTNFINGLPLAIVQLLGLAGAGEGLSIIGGALLTSAAMKAAAITIGMQNV